MISILPRTSPFSCGVLETTFVNSMEALQAVMQEADDFLEAHAATPKTAYAVRLALEELATNTIKYGYDDHDQHRIGVTLALGEPAMMTLTDDGHAFNPLTDAPPATLDGAVEDRPIGGLGLHMIKEMGMRLAYSRDDGRNVLHVTFPS